MYTKICVVFIFCILLSGSAPANNNKRSGSTSFISLKAFLELYISSNLVLESSGITPGDLSGSTTTVCFTE